MTATALQPVPQMSPWGILKPLLLLAALAFFGGFGGYLIVGPHHVLRAGEPTAPVAAVAGPTDAATAPEPAAVDDGDTLRKT